MSQLQDCRTIVVGAGVFGRASALALARVGAKVTIIDPDPSFDTASAIAAGMLAPAFEAALDPHSAGDFQHLAQARDLWPAFAEGLGDVGLVRCGALAFGDEAARERLHAALLGAGAAVTCKGGEVFTPDDWRIEPRLALAAMARGLKALGATALTGQVIAADAGSVRLDGGVQLEADAVVLACGYGGLNLAPELAGLLPIKGQLLRLTTPAFNGGPILRGESAYLAPGSGGPAVGASMQAGKADRAEDPAVTSALRAAAAAFSADLAGSPGQSLVAVRPAAPDGQPIIGRSVSGVWLAAGARRNGWLLAPLAAGLIVRSIGGGGDIPRFSPGRFTPDR